MGVRRQLTAAGAALALALGGGCVTADAAKKAESKKPDVTQPGVLPPPQEMMRPASATAPGGGVVQAGGTYTGAGQPGSVPNAPVAVPAAAPSVSPLAKLLTRPEKKVPATEMAVAWRNRIAYLPDPSRNGAMGAGLAGQLFLYGGPKLEFALADGTLTVDLIDETPRPAGQPAATPERWQFDKATLRNLRTVDETFGKSYVLFLPWPAYKSDITKVRISARYDPDNGQTLYAQHSTVSIDTSGPLGTQVWDGTTTTGPGAGNAGPTGGRSQQPFGAGALPPSGGMAPGAFPAAIPLGGGAMPLGPVPPGPATNEPLLPFAITVGQR